MSNESSDTSKSQAKQEESGKPLNLDSIRNVDLPSAVEKVEGNQQRANGSSVKAAYKHRTISYYPVTDGELDQIAAFNKVSAALFAGGSFILGWSIDLGKDLYLTSDMDDPVRNTVTGFAAAGTVLSIVLFVIGAYFWHAKNQQSGKIKTESVDDF